MTAYLVPTSPTAKKFTIFLSGVQYTLRLTWCAPSNSWILDIRDIDDVPMLSGVPLVTGADLLEQFAYVGIGGQMIVQTNNDPGAVPTYENLGSTGNLFYLSDLAQ